MKKLTKTLFTSLLLMGLMSTTAFAEWRPNEANPDNDFFWFQNVNFTPNMEDHKDYGASLAIVSASSYYDKARNQGRERGRIWARPNNAKRYFQSQGTVVGIQVSRAVLQFQSRWWDGNLRITGYIPMRDEVNKITIPPLFYEVFGVVDKWWGPVTEKVISKIDGFTTASIDVEYPDAYTDWAHYVEFYNGSGLSKIELPDEYTFVEAEQASNNLYMGGSAKWYYELGDTTAQSYDVSVVGRVLYSAQMEEPVSGYYYYTSAWTDNTWTHHQVNKPLP